MNSLRYSLSGLMLQALKYIELFQESPIATFATILPLPDASFCTLIPESSCYIFPLQELMFDHRWRRSIHTRAPHVFSPTN
jgi:hypothetical protein